MSTIEPPAVPKEEEKTYLTPAQWAEIVELWELGEVHLADLTTRFGISASGLSKGFKSRGVTRGSRAHEVAAKVRSAVLATKVDDAQTAEQLRQDRIRDTRDEHYKSAKFISGQITALLVTSVRDKTRIENDFGNIKALRLAAATLAITRSERFAVLNADDDLGEGDLPTLPLEDLSDADIIAAQNRDENEDTFAPEEPDVADLVTIGT